MLNLIKGLILLTLLIVISQGITTKNRKKLSTIDWTKVARGK